jgi:hypothetical protein
LRTKEDILQRINNSMCSYVSFCALGGPDCKEALLAKATCQALLWSIDKYVPELDLFGDWWNEIVGLYINASFNPKKFNIMEVDLF